MFSEDGSLHVDRRALADKADEMDARIRQMTSMRNGLRHAAACRASDHMACPKFRRLVGIAAAKKVRRRG